MTALSLRCVKAAFLFLALGIGLGASFAIDRAIGAQLRPLHAELNLWGWVTLLIYGFAYHMLPRFSGRPLRSRRLADVQSWLAIGGVALAACGWLGLALHVPFARPMAVVGGLCQVAAMLLFVWQAGALLAPERMRAR
jgi:heme/copper-type cytochrome/quinol oxidase subunit 1